MVRPNRRGALSVPVLVLCLAVGVFIGVGGFTFALARGGSYLSSDPVACINCHIMREAHDSWQKSSHHAMATCNDCHVPHDIIGKLLTKADNGFRHSWGFTFQDFHEPIQVHPRSHAVIQRNCMACHGELVGEIAAHSWIEADEVNCVRCHMAVGHGARR
jgi:cytochrome c nitrite reductase small subunit